MVSTKSVAALSRLTALAAGLSGACPKYAFSGLLYLTWIMSRLAIGMIADVTFRALVVGLRRYPYARIHQPVTADPRHRRRLIGGIRVQDTVEVRLPPGKRRDGDDVLGAVVHRQQQLRGLPLRGPVQPAHQVSLKMI